MGTEGIAPRLLTSALDGGKYLTHLHAPAALPSRKESRYI
jgi:hypothetical protein